MIQSASPRRPAPAILTAIMLFALTLTANAQTPTASKTDMTTTTTPPPVLKVYRHSTWEAHPPVGHAADAMRRNLPPGANFEFKGLSITLSAMNAAPEGVEGATDTAVLGLVHEGNAEERTVKEGEAFNWSGFHIALPAIRATKGELGFGVTEVEVATLASLPKEVADSKVAGGAEMRLRVPHTINKITLHHSATELKPGDILGKKLAAMQTWGQSDRRWWDVPYHFFVDLDGNYWEGRDYRFMGETNTTYNPWGYFLINCYGNWEANEPNQKQIEAVANMMAWACAEFGVSPEELYGHKDLAQTSCPGKNLYRYLEDGTFKRMVKERLEKGAPKLEYVDEAPK